MRPAALLMVIDLDTGSLRRSVTLQPLEAYGVILLVPGPALVYGSGGETVAGALFKVTLDTAPNGPRIIWRGAPSGGRTKKEREKKTKRRRKKKKKRRRRRRRRRKRREKSNE